MFFRLFLLCIILIVARLPFSNDNVTIERIQNMPNSKKPSDVLCGNGYSAFAKSLSKSMSRLSKGKTRGCNIAKLFSLSDRVLQEEKKQ
jgi:hypothetical protein